MIKNIKHWGIIHFIIKNLKYIYIPYNSKIMDGVSPINLDVLIIMIICIKEIFFIYR